MSLSHQDALKHFVARITRLLMLRRAVQWLTVWFFIWGAITLAVRMAGFNQTYWLALGIFFALPAILFAALRARREIPDFAKVRASYDQLNACGGVVMASEAANESTDMRAWFDQLAPASVPQLQWHSARALWLLLVAAGFAATTLLLPERLTHLAQRHLEINQIVEQLKAEVQTLTQEKIVDDKKSEDLQKQLAQVEKDSSAYDPNKTWEALDHIKQANSDAAKQAAEEAIKKTESLTQAETLAKAMEMAAENGMEASTAAQAAQELASLLNAAKLEEGVLNGKIPPELLQNLSGLQGLNQEQMEQLMQALAANKGNLSNTMSNLANLKMIDAATLAKMQAAASQSKSNCEGLALYLSQCKGGGKCDSDILFSWLKKNGGGRGGPGAEMDWDNDTSEQNLKFQEHALPPSQHMNDAQIVGVSKAAPELAKADASAEHGALDNAAASGGSAHAQVILPEHRQAVQKFFKREGK
jgi:hypothetical protein